MKQITMVRFTLILLQNWVDGSRKGEQIYFNKEGKKLDTQENIKSSQIWKVL